MKKLKILFLLPMIFILTGCTSFMEKTLNSWVNYSIDDVIKQWGVPTAEKIIRNQKMYIWAEPSVCLNYNSGYCCIRTLYVDDRDIVKSWTYEGNNCPFAGSKRHKWVNPSSLTMQDYDEMFNEEIINTALKYYNQSELTNKEREILKAYLK